VGRLRGLRAARRSRFRVSRARERCVYLAALCCGMRRHVGRLRKQEPDTYDIFEPRGFDVLGLWLWRALRELRDGLLDCTPWSRTRIALRVELPSLATTLSLCAYVSGRRPRTIPARSTSSGRNGSSYGSLPYVATEGGAPAPGGGSLAVSVSPDSTKRDCRARVGVSVKLTAGGEGLCGSSVSADWCRPDAAVVSHAR